jgi:Xaa-Pro dipeptidase
MNQKRMEKLLDLLELHSLAGVALNPGPSLTYLTDLHFHLMERPTVLLLTPLGSSALILPVLEKGKLQEGTPYFQAFTYGDDPATWQAAFDAAVQWLNLESGEIGVEPNRLRFLELSYLQAALPNIHIVDGSSVLGELRIRKDQDEVAKMREAVKIAQSALLATLRKVQEGMTEREIANQLIINLLKAGSDPEMPFSPIVATGENCANPHAVPTDRALRKGDLLLIDWGAGYQGYFSDITRTFTYGEVDPELVRIGEIVLEANRAGRETGKPGGDAGAVDRAARFVIAEAGYGDAFFHRTGHGLGMEAHEPPYIFGENEFILAPGMTFTVEPGIYLADKGGVRIEDDVVITETGLESLTDFPRDVLPVEDYWD